MSNGMAPPLPLTLIVAATRSNAIGRASSLPWRLPKEMAYFARVTKGGSHNAVIMGRKSWDGIPTKFRPLPGRTNVVVSRQPEFDLSVAVRSQVGHWLWELTLPVMTKFPVAISGESADSFLSSSLEQACTRLDERADVQRTFLIGGAQLYTQAMETLDTPTYRVERLLLTRIKTDFADCDAFFPAFESDERGAGWTRATHEQLQEWVGFDVPAGDQTERDRTGGGDVVYEFQMWTR